MSALAVALEDYLALRRALGYKLERAGALLGDLVAYLERAGTEHLSVELAVGWAMLAANPDSGWRAQRLGVARCFARYLHALDPRHQVPPQRLLGRGRRPAPFLYTESDLLALMDAARRLGSPLRAVTHEMLIGLLAVSGLRVGEVIRLDRDDLDLGRGLLVVRDSKGGRTRHVPLHPSVIEALGAYLARRDALIAIRTRRRSSSQASAPVCAPATFEARSSSSCRRPALRATLGEAGRDLAIMPTSSLCRPRRESPADWG